MVFSVVMLHFFSDDVSIRVVLSPVWYSACTIKIGRWCELRSSTPYFIELVRGETCKHPHIWGEKLGFPSLVLQIIPIIPWFKIQNTYNKCHNLVFCQKWLGYIGSMPLPLLSSIPCGQVGDDQLQLSDPITGHVVFRCSEDFQRQRTVGLAWPQFWSHLVFWCRF